MHQLGVKTYDIRGETKQMVISFQNTSAIKPPDVNHVCLLTFDKIGIMPVFKNIAIDNFKATEML